MMCRRCSSTNNVKCGFRNGKQCYKCKECGSQFVVLASKSKPARVYKIGANYIYVARMFARGQITVPVEIRRFLQVKEGDEVLFTHNKDSEIVLCNTLQIEPLPLIYISRKITRNGQLVIPADIRRLLQIKEGDNAVFMHNENGELVIGVALNTEPPNTQNAFADAA